MFHSLSCHKLFCWCWQFSIYLRKFQVVSLGNKLLLWVWRQIIFSENDQGVYCTWRPKTQDKWFHDKTLAGCHRSVCCTTLAICACILSDEYAHWFYFCLFCYDHYISSCPFLWGGTFNHILQHCFANTVTIAPNINEVSLDDMGKIDQYPDTKKTHQNINNAATANFVGPTLAQRGSCRLHVGPTWAQCTLLSGCTWLSGHIHIYRECCATNMYEGRG